MNLFEETTLYFMALVSISAILKHIKLPGAYDVFTKQCSIAKEISALLKVNLRSLSSEAIQNNIL